MLTITKTRFTTIQNDTEYKWNYPLTDFSFKCDNYVRLN